MHKITKGLKKKKKGKKSKHKEEELFKPEELEAYRREHQKHQEGEEPAASGGEEWKKFTALTSGVDDILKKTQEDLDRIKTTSFFQRVPPPSEVKKREEEARQLEVEQQLFEQSQQEPTPAEVGIVQISDSEEESEDDDDVFDTAYIDAIAAGEVKLAYIPESPTEPQTGDDPFDTSYAEKAILGPVVERKGKKLVPIGSAVEVLTGRVQAPTCATRRPVPNRRQILKERDLLLGSFDDNANSIPVVNTSPEIVKKTLLDDDAPLPAEPIDLSKSIYIPPTPVQEPSANLVTASKNVLEFDVINNIPVDDEDDEEFAILAAESFNKTPVVFDKLPITPVAEVKTENWGAFDEKNNGVNDLNENDEDIDPFDTTIAENILPGKAELKQIESEILNQENDIDFNPRAENKLTEILNTVSIRVTNPTGQRESVSSLDRVSEEDLNFIRPIHRDLLGGSNTDLSNLSDQPLKPAEKADDDYIEYCDPFDTSIVESVKLPGQTELKFLEKELLGDIKVQKKNSLSDDEFDPRAEEDRPRERTISRPDVLNIGVAKTVSFDLPSTDSGDLLGAPQEPTTKKPLTPFYVRKNSVPGQHVEEEEEINEDPFDTSFVAVIGPGKTELKLIESELFNPETERHLSLSDQDFDPRNDKKVQIAQVVQTINEIYYPTSVKPTSLPIEAPKPIDLLAIDHDVSAKVLTPAAEKPTDIEDIIYSDPFDTSIAVNILPGKTELKLLESELINSDNQTIKRNLTDPEFDPRTDFNPVQPIDLLEPSEDIVIRRPLSPISGQTISFDIGTPQDIDPFDTSFANNIGPGKTELKLLESELI